MTHNEYQAMVASDIQMLVDRDWYAASFTKDGPDSKVVGISELTDDFKMSLKGFGSGEGAIAMHLGNLSHPGLRQVTMMPLEQAEGLHAMLGRMIDRVKLEIKAVA